MRIAIATDGEYVAAHFGRCPSYTLVDIDSNGVENKTLIANPGHEPGFLPGYLAQKGVTVVICGGMGPRAQGLFAENGVSSIIGVSGAVNEVIKSYLSGDIKTGPSSCSHINGEDHEHGHGDGCC